MEFEEMKKIWDTQKLEHVFTIDQSALHRRVLTKQTQGLHITNMSEWLLIFVNVIAPISILFMMLSNNTINISMVLLSCWMFVNAGYVAYQRRRRINGSTQFERTLAGDLQFALDVARYQVRLSTLGRWNILPIGILSLTGLIEADKPFWIAAALVVFLVITNYAAGMEANFYKRRFTELESLKKKLEEPG
jgi:hypothetical protein